MGNATAGLAGGVIKGDDTKAKAKPEPPAAGAVHSAEIEYALGNLSTNRVYDWQPEDQKVSEIMQTMFANFIKSGNPNGLGTPNWPVVKPGVPASVMRIDVWSRAETEKTRERYLIQDALLKK
jgi:para-nitrobenzyl esterase